MKRTSQNLQRVAVAVARLARARRAGVRAHARAGAAAGRRGGGLRWPGFLFLSLLAGALLVVAKPLVQRGLRALPAFAGQDGAIVVVGSLAQTKPRLRCDASQFARLGSTVSRSESLMPSHLPIVAAYWSTDVDGSRRPWPTSSGPSLATTGGVP